MESGKYQLKTGDQPNLFCSQLTQRPQKECGHAKDIQIQAHALRKKKKRERERHCDQSLIIPQDYISQFEKSLQNLFFNIYK